MGRSTSGIATSMMSGLGEILFFGSESPLPEDFGIYLPMLVHKIAAKAFVIGPN